MYNNQHSAGKGDRPRSGFNKKKFDKRMDEIFSPKEIKTWNPDEEEKTKKSKNSRKSKD